MRLCRNSAGTQDASLCREFLNDTRLTLHDCRGQEKTLIEDVGNQCMWVWTLSDLLKELLVLIIWIISARCLTRRRAKSGFVLVEQDDKFGKNDVRKLNSARQGDVLSDIEILWTTWKMRLITSVS